MPPRPTPSRLAILLGLAAVLAACASAEPPPVHVLSESSVREDLARAGYANPSGLMELGNGLWIGTADYAGRLYTVEIHADGSIVRR
jgi:hypothetical protein